MRREALRSLEPASSESIAVPVRAVRFFSLFADLWCLCLPAVDIWHKHSPLTPIYVHLCVRLPNVRSVCGQDEW